MEDKYIPPYEITDEMLELVSEIMENLGKLWVLMNWKNYQGFAE